MAENPSLTTQTLYAELMDRCGIAAFDASFPSNGSFIRVTVKNRPYWYFQDGARDASGRQPRKYVGADTPEIQDLIRNHGQAKSDYRERRRLVALLHRSGYQSPPDEIGRTLQALALSGVFRMRACLVGTAAYQAYGPMLGVRMPHAAMQTGDIDIAQFTAVSVAIGQDELSFPLLEILRRADPSFRAVPHTSDAGASTTYVNESGLRIEFLAESRGPERDAPAMLPAIGTHAQPLRFMDFLIRDEIPAAILYDAGVLVNVPTPARYAIHKLILSQRRRQGTAKVNKDVLQAQSLIDVLAAGRPAELHEAWVEATRRGKRWRSLAVLGLAMITANVRDRALHVIGEMRNIIPELDLQFRDSPPRYDLITDTLYFDGWSGLERVVCAISREALDDHFAADALSKRERLDIFRHYRASIQHMARVVYLNRPVPADGSVLIRTADVPALQLEVVRTTSVQNL